MSTSMDVASQPVLDARRDERKEARAPAALSEKDLIAQWLERLDSALQSGSIGQVAAVFAPECHWRDLLAFTWSITPAEGAERIATSMVAKQGAAQARRFGLAQGRTPPRRVQRAGLDVIEGIFQFETALGRGYGVLRLLADSPTKAFQLMTSLHELKGFEERIGPRRPTGQAFSRNFGGTNWKEQRIASQEYSDREPVVLVSGGGQAGLAIAATLGRLDIDTLVVDKHERVGDCWRKRYHSLALHNSTEVNHLPYMPFPPSWPKYLPKDMLADWFEAYAGAMEINYWTGTEFVRGSYDDSTQTWTAVLRKADGTERIVRPRHIILANGLVGIANVPDLPGLRDFRGSVVHTSEYGNGADWRGKKALVIGTGSSGHDIAQDLHAYDCETTIVQRGSCTVVSIDPAGTVVYGR
jgi:putative flavoprotein involved in K+ transport